MRPSPAHRKIKSSHPFVKYKIYWDKWKANLGKIIPQTSFQASHSIGGKNAFSLSKQWMWQEKGRLQQIEVRIGPECTQRHKVLFLLLFNLLCNRGHAWNFSSGILSTQWPVSPALYLDTADTQFKAQRAQLAVSLQCGWRERIIEQNLAYCFKSGLDSEPMFVFRMAVVWDLTLAEFMFPRKQLICLKRGLQTIPRTLEHFPQALSWLSMARPNVTDSRCFIQGSLVGLANDL